MKRGIVTNPVQMNFNKNGALLSFGDALTVQDINYFCFYWDDVIILDSENVHIDVVKEKELIDCGIVRRPVMKKPEGLLKLTDFPSLYTDFQIETINSIRDKEKGTHWHLHYVGDRVIYDTEVKRNLQLRLELLDALRIPDEDVHIEDILRFKDDCKDDLDALHEYLDKLYFEILESKDFNLTKAKNFSLLSEAITNLDKSVGGKWKNKHRVSVNLEPELDGSQVIELLAPLYNGVVTGCYGGVTHGMVAALLTTIPSFIKFRRRWVEARDKGTNDLLYITKAMNKGLIQRK